MSYKNIYAPLLWLLTVSLLTACSLQPADYPTPSEPKADSDRLIVLCEGLWGMDNSSLSLIDNGVLTNRWFQQQNPGRHLGDTGNDILQVNDTLIAISVNWSNIVQYIRPDGTAIAATENIPNNRRLATDHNGYLYVTSYADNGYVAKVDLRTKQVVDTCHVGREPEGIAYYDGRLYVANTGGYATQTKDHDYEQTVSVVDAQTMRELRRIDTGHKNLYGKPAQWGQYLCINAAGDYYNQPPQCIILNMANDEFRTFDFPATYCCAYQGRFYILGSAYSYITEAYAFSAHTISLPSMEAEEGLAAYDAATATILQMQSPYGIYISPYTGHLYASDARAYATNGYVYEFGRDGKQLNRYLLRGVNPSGFLAWQNPDIEEERRNVKLKILKFEQ